MIAYWPTTLPQKPLTRYAGGFMDNRVSFTPDAGPPIERPRTTGVPEVYEVTLRVLTKDQYATFKEWFRSDLKFGTIKFIFRDPLTDDPKWYRIVKGNPPFQMEVASDDYVSVSMRMMQVPGDPWFAEYVPAGVSRVPSFVADYDSDQFGIEGEKVAGSALEDIEGEYLVETTNETTVQSEVQTLTAGDITSIAPAGVTRILGFRL